MVVGDLSVLNDQVMGKHTAHRFVEATTDGFLWHREIVPGLGVASMQLSKCLVYTMQRDSSRVSLGSMSSHGCAR